MTNTLLAHIAATIPQKENLATSALAFILNRSKAACEALAADLSRVVGEPLSIAGVSTQVAVGDESRPDLVLHDDKGGTLGFIEAKFWAALTEAQPVDYILRLEERHGTVLVILAPEKRLTMLRDEVIERCRIRAKEIVPASNGPSVLRSGSVSVCFIAWPRVLKVLTASVVSEPEVSSDVRQLAGLCTRLEGEGFIPLMRADIDDLDVPRRVLALAHLVNDIVDQAVAKGVLSVKGLKATHFLGATGRYAAFASATCWIGLTHWQWAERGRSPLWVRFLADEWGRADGIREKFRPWATEDPPRAYLDDENHAVRVPLLLRIGVEKNVVVADAVRQVREIDALVKSAGLPPLSGVAPAEP